MTLNAREPQGDGDFQLAPEGTHIARCYRLIDMGTQHSEMYDKWQPKVMVAWELCDEKMDDGRPFTVAGFYTNSLHEKATLRQHLESWRGKRFTAEELSGFDLRNVLGKPCLVSIVHNDSGKRTYANVQSVTALPKGTTAPELVNEQQFYDIDQHDEKVFESLGKGLQEKINKSQERDAAKSWGAPEHGADDMPAGEDIPF